MCLHAGEQAAWGEGAVVASMHGGRHVPYEQGKRRRAASGRLCFAMPAPIPRRAAAARMHVCSRGAGGLGGPLLLLSAEKTIASSHEDIRRALWAMGVGDWAAVEAEWQMASGLLCCSVSDGGR